MKVEGYEGICAACFSPIRNGEGMTIREKGRHFHINCVALYPDNYYVRLERRIFATKLKKEVKR